MSFRLDTFEKHLLNFHDAPLMIEGFSLNTLDQEMTTQISLARRVTTAIGFAMTEVVHIANLAINILKLPITLLMFPFELAIRHCLGSRYPTFFIRTCYAIKNSIYAITYNTPKLFFQSFRSSFLWKKDSLFMNEYGYIKPNMYSYLGSGYNTAFNFWDVLTNPTTQMTIKQEENGGYRPFVEGLDKEDLYWDTYSHSECMRKVTEMSLIARDILHVSNALQDDSMKVSLKENQIYINGSLYTLSSSYVPSAIHTYANELLRSRT